MGAKRRLTPDQIFQIVNLKTNNPRYSAKHIAERAGVSESSVKRVLTDHHVNPKALREDVLNSVRERLTDQYMRDKNIRMLFANQAVTALNQIALANEKMSQAWEQMNATDINDAALVFRAASNHASALRNQSECMKALFGEIKIETQEDLPTLYVVTMTDDDVRRERQRQQMELEEIEGVGTSQNFDDEQPDDEPTGLEKGVVFEDPDDT
ncbi:MAG: hypothetical protein H6998_00080 [Hahellaceae bacterium]|nr:hypothetical protein [Hahellaceae bacterium]